MLVGTEQAYRAVASRDTRFDGCFITAVRTTKIYCRPSCPARTPKPDNVEFLPTTAAAQAAGYRACRRCLPDAVPGSPEWDLRADLAGRAMRLINDGLIERAGVTGLADTLGYSTRHLTRVLTAELGAGPLNLARAHRAHSARVLIETTRLSFADAAFAAGFASLRQFNDTIRAVFATTPSALRERAVRRATTSPATAGTLHLRLPFRLPCDTAGTLEFLADRAIAGVENVSDEHYTRALRLPHGVAVATLHPEEDHVATTLRLTDLRDLGTAVTRLRRLLDLDADPVAVDDTLSTDPALAEGIQRTPGMRVPGSVDGSEIVFRSVIGQQVSVARARTATQQLVDTAGDPLEFPADGVTRLFPTPESVAAYDLPGPRRRAETLRTVATALADGSLQVHPGRDAEELREDLCRFTGIGTWTANYIAMRVLGDPDILLDGDLALRRGAGALGLPSEAGTLRSYGSRWSPWRSYAGIALWRAGKRTTRKETT